MRRWHLRTVRNGQIRIQGRVYRPSEAHMPYDGRLDGLRFLFALYEGQEDLASLCPISLLGAPQYSPEVVDGTLPWIFWHAAASTPKEKREE